MPSIAVFHGKHARSSHVGTRRSMARQLVTPSSRYGTKPQLRPRRVRQRRYQRMERLTIRAHYVFHVKQPRATTDRSGAS